MQFDETGKVSLDHIYSQPDPRAYFSTLRELDYYIPQVAKPYFARLIEDYRRSQRIAEPTVVDIGCSYGINAALLNYDATMDELYERYCAVDAAALSRSGLLVRDQQLVQSRSLHRCARFVGLDNAYPALSYARSAGFLDLAVHANLEVNDPNAQQRAHLAEADMVISTGCLGYVTHRTLAQVVSLNEERLPWMAHFVLRMFPFDPVADCLAELGYETVGYERVFKQRHFASLEEQLLVLDTLSGVGVDPNGLETEGWFYAQLHVSRPRVTKERVFVDLVSKPASSY